MPRKSLMSTTLAAALCLGAGAALAQNAPIPPAPPFQQTPPASTVDMRKANQERMNQLRMNRERMIQVRMAERRAMRDARRAMALEMRLAGLKAGLAIGPEQEAAWKSLDQAIRDLDAARRPAHPPETGANLSPGQRLRMRADQLRARADAMTKVADALGPLEATFTDEQKLRFKALGARLLHAGSGPFGAWREGWPMQEGGQWGGMRANGGPGAHARSYEDMAGMYGHSGWPQGDPGGAVPGAPSAMAPPGQGWGPPMEGGRMPGQGHWGDASQPPADWTQRDWNGRGQGDGWSSHPRATMPGEGAAGEAPPQDDQD